MLNQLVASDMANIVIIDKKIDIKLYNNNLCDKGLFVLFFYIKYLLSVSPCVII